MVFSSKRRISKTKRVRAHPRYVTWIHPDDEPQKNNHDNDDDDDDDDEEIQDFITIQKLCRPLFFLLKCTSINVDFETPDREGCLVKFYRGILILVCLVNAAANVFGLYHFFKDKIDGNPTNITNFVFLDHWVAMSILVNFCLKRRRIIEVLRDIFELLRRVDRRILLQKVRRMAVIFSTLCLADVSFFMINVFFQIYRYNDEEFKSYYLDFYFGVPSPTTSLGVISVIVASDVPYAIFMACSNLSLCLIVLICSMLECCFQQLNSREISVKWRRREHQLLRRYQCHHQAIAHLVLRINALFSPVILILIGTKTAHIIAASDVMKSALKMAIKYPNTVSSFVEKFAHICTSVGLIVTLTIKAGKLAHEAQKTFDVFLDICLENNDVYFERLEIHKIHHLSTLFAAQRIISPVTLTASDFFTINYSLLAVVISTTITYITLISESSKKCQE